MSRSALRILPFVKKQVVKCSALLPVVACHALARTNQRLAVDLSELLRGSINRSTRGTYQCGFASLTDFCRSVHLCAMPVDAITLAAWMMEKCKTVKVKSVVKYVCGIRFAHIMEGHDWKLSDHPLIQKTLAGLKKQYPSSNTLQKVPLSLPLLLNLCRGMSGWPALEKLSFDNLTWATASCIAFFAALRGGEFFVQPKSDRPLLSGAAVLICESEQGPYVLINVPSPKTRKDLASIPAMACSSALLSDFIFDPVVLLRCYRRRAARLGINVLGHNAAFKSQNNKPIDRRFMIERAERLRAAAGIEILNTEGKPIKVSAASWRAGFVMSSRQADVSPSTMRSNGRWTSISGPVPYMVDTLELFQQMSRQLVSDYYKRNRKSVAAGGKFVSSNLLL